jgi:hypothetical protein
MKKTIALLMIVFLPQAHAHWEEFVRSPDGEKYQAKRHTIPTP